MTIADLKAGTPETFAEYAGGNLEAVTANLEYAAAAAGALLVRIPLITGINDTPRETGAMVEILKEIHRIRMAEKALPLAVEILKLHHFGAPKYQALGWDYQLAGRPEPEAETVAELERQLAELSIEIQRN